MPKLFLSDEQWKKIERLLPQPTGRGRPWADNRRVLEGILWVLKTGARLAASHACLRDLVQRLNPNG